MSEKPLRILCFGAHPDDADFRFAGFAMHYRALGHQVKFVSLTNGDHGHQSQGGLTLVRRRYAEAMAAAKIADVEYEVLDISDTELEASIENRKTVIRIIRQYAPDLVLCHRACDYHADHRAVGQLVQDASYLLTVPHVCPLTPHLSFPPVVAYLFDRFTRPEPFRADVALDTDSLFERKARMAACHESQVYEWLPYNDNHLADVPTDPEERFRWFVAKHEKRFMIDADLLRPVLKRIYGEQRGSSIRTAEALMFSEYGLSVTPEIRQRLFPFIP
jgi:LmbE family N-acetylglucosaminyl deacetylase